MRCLEGKRTLTLTYCYMSTNSEETTESRERVEYTKVEERGVYSRVLFFFNVLNLVFVLYKKTHYF